MADDNLFGGKPLTEATDATKAATEATKAYTKSVEANLPALQNFKNRLRELEEEQKDLGKIWEEQKESLRKWAEGMYGAEASVKKMTGAVRNAHDWLNKNIGAMKTYNRLLKELRTGQDLYAKSAMASTKANVDHSAAMQKSINMVRESKRAAHDMAVEYGLDQKEMRKVTEGVNKAFHTQIRQTEDYKGKLRGLSKDILLVSKRFGVDGAEAIKYMQSRMMASTNTLSEAQQETMLVAKATDEYIQQLNKIPGALDGAYASQKDFYEAMAKANQTFKMGNLDAAAYAQQLKVVMVRAKELKYTTNQVQAASEGLAKMMAGMQDEGLKSIFGIQSVQDLDTLRETIDQLGDTKAKEQLEIAIKQTEGLAAPQRMQVILQSLKGTRAQAALTLKHFEKMSKPVRMALLQEKGMDPKTAVLLANNTEKLREVLEKETGEGRKGETDEFRKALDSSLKEWQKADSPQYRLVQEIQKSIDFMVDMLKYTGIPALAFISAKSALQLRALAKSYLEMKKGGTLEHKQIRELQKIHRAIRMSGGVGGGGGGRGRRGRKRRGGRMRFRRGRRPRFRGGGKWGALAGLGASFLPIPGGEMADRAMDALDIASFAPKNFARGALGKIGSLARGAGGLARGALGATRGFLMQGAAGSGLAGAGAVAGAGLAGYALGTYLDKKFKLSDKISKRLFYALNSSEAAKEIEGALPLSQRMSKKMVNKYKDSLDLIKKFNDMQMPLNENQRKLRKEAEQYVKKYKQGWRAHLKNVKEAGKTYKKEQLEDVGGGFDEGTYKEAMKLKDPRERARMIMSRITRSSRRLYTQASGAGALQKVLTGDLTGMGLVGIARSITLREKLKEAGISPEMALKVGKEELLKTQKWAYKQGEGGADLRKKFKAEEAMRTIAQYGALKTAGVASAPPELMEKVKAARQTLVKMGLDEQMLSKMKDAQAQDGNYKVTDKSMTYNITIPLKMNLENMWAGLRDAGNKPGANNSSTGTVS